MNEPAAATAAGTSGARFERAFLLLAGGDDVRLCKDIPDSACREQPGNFFRHLLAALGNKLADEIASARLVLPWLLAQLGAGGAAVGWLVPIREAGTLVPQLLVAAWLRRLALRKYAWAFGGLTQALAAAGMAVVALAGDGPAGVASVLGLLLLLALGRGFSSIATKDVMGKTIAKSRRGTLMGWSDSVASVLALVIGLTLPLLGERPERGLLAALLLLAAGGWLLNALCALTMREEPGATEGAVNAGAALLEGLQLLRADPAFVRFNLSRGLLLGSALSLPYLVVLAHEHSDADLAGLGVLIVASNLGVFLSSPFWGRWADRSSRHVMAAAGALAGLTTAVALASDALPATLAGSLWYYGALYGVLAAAHAGIQLGRKTWVDDLGGPKRALYVAMSNTLAGVLMLAAGALTGLIARFWGHHGALLLLTAMALAGAVSTLWLKDAE